MKREVPILIFILILVLRQAPPELMLDHKFDSSSILHEMNAIIWTQGLGWIEYLDKGDPDEMPPVFQAFQNENQLFFGATILRHFRYLSHCHTNPLLIDRPPPDIVARTYQLRERITNHHLLKSYNHV